MGTASGRVSDHVHHAAGQRLNAFGMKKPLAAYLRLTLDRDGKKLGYDVQIHAIKKWAEYAGETIGAWYKDKDITAADAKKQRPEYERMLRDVEAGVWGGIVVWRLDRLMRLAYELERCIRICEDVNARIICLDPSHIDSSTDLGKLFMRLLVMLAEMEINTMKTRARGHRRERARKGMYNGGGARPYGFEGPLRDDPDDPDKVTNSGRVGIMHVEAEIKRLREAAQRIAWEGVGWSDIIAEWHAENPPAYGATGAPWSVQTLQGVLTRPRAVGKREAELEDPETGELVTQLVEARWEPIIDEKTWEKLKALVKHVGSRGGKQTYLLTGLVQCGRCQKGLTGAQRRYKKQGAMAETNTYRCKSGPEGKAAGACGKLNVISEPVERKVIATVLAYIAETPTIVQALAKHGDVDRTELTDAMAVIAECDEQLVQATRVGIRMKWTDQQYEAAQEEIAVKRSEAVRTVDRVSRQMAVPLPSAEDYTNLLGWYEKLTATQQRALLRSLVRSVEVLATGRSGPRFDPKRVVVALTDLE